MFEDYGEFPAFAGMVAAGGDVVRGVIEKPLCLPKQDAQLTVHRIDHGGTSGLSFGRPAAKERWLSVEVEVITAQPAARRRAWTCRCSPDDQGPPLG